MTFLTDTQAKKQEPKLYAFGRYEYYDSYIPAADQADYEYTDRNRMAVGLNYYPVPQIVVKGEYSKRFLKSNTTTSLQCR